MWNNALRLLDTVSDGSTGGIVPAENIDKMWSTLITGLVVVFLILVILVAILWGMGKLLNMNIKIKRKPKEAKAAPAGAPASAPGPAPAPAPSTPAPAEAEEYYDEDDSEIIAVIAAAIAAYSELDGKQYRIASVRKRDRSQRSSWSAAGISENTRPF